MKKRFLIFLAITALIIPIALFGLISTETGSRWLLQGIFSVFPGQIKVETTQGRLLDHITLSGLHYQSDSEIITANHIELSWRPLQLLSGTLSIIDLIINDLNISAAKTQAESTAPEPTETDISLPLQLDISNLLVTNLQYSSNEQTQSFDKLQLAAQTEDKQFKLISLLIQSELVNATAKGSVTLEKPYPLAVSADWQVQTESNGSWQGQTALNGNLDKLSFENQLASPFKLALKGVAETVLTTLRINAQGDWQDLNWPLVTKPTQVHSPLGHFKIAGLLSDYHLSLSGLLNQHYVPDSALTFDGKGSLEAMTINKLELKSSTGLFRVTGNTSWGDIPGFDVTATGQQFNPAILIPELPGSLDFNSRIKGTFDPKATQITTDIAKLNGQLRKQSLNANGKLSLNGEELMVDNFLAAFGVNKVKIDGLIGQTSGNLGIVMDMPRLSTLWPSLGGSLTGKGIIQGGWQGPTVKFYGKGKQLKFDQHSLSDLALNIDIQANEQYQSTFNLSANAIKSGTVIIDKLNLSGKGTPKQHSLKANIQSPQANLLTELAGGWSANRWQGDIAKLNIAPKDGKTWVLNNNMPLKLEKKPQGFDVTINEGCLVQESASLCSKGNYLETGDLNFKLTAKALPTRLLQAFLPEKMQLISLVIGDVDIKRKKGVWDGSYSAAATPAQVLFKANESQQEIHLGPTVVSGTIKGDKVSAGIGLNLAEHDYLRSKLLFDIGKAQTVSGQVTAVISEWAVIRPFIPEISAINGQLKAELGVQGQLSKPQINGNLSFTNGLIEAGSAGLHEIDLQLIALGNRSNSIQVQGTALPVILNQPNSPEKIHLKSIINLGAELQVQNQIAGNFNLKLPGGTVITMENQAEKKELRLGATTLSGNIRDETLSADLAMALTGQDNLTGTMQLDMGNSQALSAQVTASVRELKMVEVFIPQLSDIKGQLKADMSAKGTLHNPLLNGEFNLTNASAAVNKLGIDIRDIVLKAYTSASSSSIIQLLGSAKSGDGLIKLGGQINLHQDTSSPSELTLTGDNFEVAKLPEAQITVSPDLKVTMTENKRLINGKLVVPKAIMALQELPENAVGVSEDEVILGEEKPIADNTPQPDITVDVDVILGDKVSFTGQGLKTNLAGNLNFVKNGPKMLTQGKISMEKARYKRYGQDLTVRKGQFLFNGPADNPWLDVEAIRLSKDKKVTAILGLTGPLQKPQTRISSDPALPETEALAYLVTGGPLNQVSKGEGNMLANAALSYGAGKATWLTEKLGIDEFEVEEGTELKDSLLVMGEYLTPDFYVGTRVGMFNKQANLVLKHKLTDRINIETQAGTSQRVKLNYEFDED